MYKKKINIYVNILCSCIGSIPTIKYIEKIEQP